MQPLDDALIGLGIQEERIHDESFGSATVLKQGRKRQPPPTPGRMAEGPVSVRFAASNVGAEWSPERGPLLELADAAGLSPSFGCRTGICGSTTNFYDPPGLEENALTMKSLGDAVLLRNRLIESLEEADTECAAKAGLREPLLTWVVAGGGFAGVETLASVNDFVREALPFYPNLRESSLRMVLVHSGEAILPELDPHLGRYARKKLEKRGIEFHLKMRGRARRGARDAQ